MLCLVCVLVSPKTFATELKAATARAFQQYVDLTEARIRGEVVRPNEFPQIDSLPETQKAAERARLLKGEIFIQSMATKEAGSPVEVPGGIVHHWLALVFIPGGTAEQALQLAQNYSRYAELYKPDIRNAKILGREGQHFRVYYRLYRHAVVTVAYNAEFDVDYFAPDSSGNYSRARSARIAEVENPGETNEREYPVGRDHGYLWRLNLIHALCSARRRRVRSSRISGAEPHHTCVFRLARKSVRSLHAAGIPETLSRDNTKSTFIHRIPCVYCGQARRHGDHHCLCSLTRSSLSAGLMGVGLVPMQEVGPGVSAGSHAVDSHSPF